MTDEFLNGVPVFPLNTVLFPGVPLPLQIFEPRYLAMLDDLRHGDQRFCVAHILQGQEVGGPAEPASVACMAEIVQLEPLPDERYYLLAVGVERVRIMSLDRQAKPYLVGTLQVLGEDSSEADSRLVSKARELFGQYVSCIMELSGRNDVQVPLPGEANRLSYLLAAALQVDAEVRQGLLEEPGSQERLSAEVRILQSEVPILRSLISRSEPPAAGYGNFSAN